MDELISKKDAEVDLNKALFLFSRDALFTLEFPSWKFTSGNLAAVKMFKVKNEVDFLSYRMEDLSTPSQPDGKSSSEKSKEMIEKAIKDGSNSYEWTYKKMNGEIFLAEVLLVSGIDENSNVFLYASIRDISERKRLEDQIKINQEEQQTILDSIPAWIFYKDNKNNFIRINKTFAKMMNKSKEELEGRSLFDLFPKEQADIYFKDDQEVINSGKPKLNIIEQINSPDGLLWVQTDKIPYKDRDGNVIGVIGFAVDITLRKLAEEEIKKHNQELEKLNKIMIGRELEMIKLKKEIEELKSIENK